MPMPKQFQNLHGIHENIGFSCRSSVRSIGFLELQLALSCFQASDGAIPTRLATNIWREASSSLYDYDKDRAALLICSCSRKIEMLRDASYADTLFSLWLMKAPSCLIVIAESASVSVIGCCYGYITTSLFSFKIPLICNQLIMQLLKGDGILSCTNRCCNLLKLRAQAIESMNNDIVLRKWCINDG